MNHAHNSNSAKETNNLGEEENNTNSVKYIDMYHKNYPEHTLSFKILFKILVRTFFGGRFCSQRFEMRQSLNWEGHRRFFSYNNQKWLLIFYNEFG